MIALITAAISLAVSIIQQYPETPLPPAISIPKVIHEPYDVKPIPQ